MSNTYTLYVYNTCTGRYENVSVTEAVYRACKQTGWNIDDNNASFFDHEIQFSQLIGGDDGAYENFREFVSDRDATENAAMRSVRRSRLIELLPTLTEKEREVIELRCIKGLSAPAVGQILGISRRAVNKRKQSAFERIRGDEKIF